MRRRRNCLGLGCGCDDGFGLGDDDGFGLGFGCGSDDGFGLGFGCGSDDGFRLRLGDHDGFRFRRGLWNHHGCESRNSNMRRRRNRLGLGCGDWLWLRNNNGLRLDNGLRLGDDDGFRLGLRNDDGLGLRLDNGLGFGLGNDDGFGLGLGLRDDNGFRLGLRNDDGLRLGLGNRNGFRLRLGDCDRLRCNGMPNLRDQHCRRSVVLVYRRSRNWDSGRRLATLALGRLTIVVCLGLVRDGHGRRDLVSGDATGRRRNIRRSRSRRGNGIGRGCGRIAIGVTLRGAGNRRRVLALRDSGSIVWSRCTRLLRHRLHLLCWLRRENGGAVPVARTPTLRRLRCLNRGLGRGSGRFGTRLVLPDKAGITRLGLRKRREVGRRGSRGIGRRGTSRLLGRDRLPATLIHRGGGGSLCRHAGGLRRSVRPRGLRPLRRGWATCGGRRCALSCALVGLLRALRTNHVNDDDDDQHDDDEADD